MSRHFRPWLPDLTQLLPAAVADYVLADHLALSAGARARALDLSEIGRGLQKRGAWSAAIRSAHDDGPAALCLYCSGLYSSGRIAKACAERVDFMMIVAHDAPDFRTIADFRKRHLPPLGRLFLQVLKLAEKAGLAKLGHVRAGRHEDQGKRLQTQGDELRPHEDARDGASR